MVLTRLMKEATKKKKGGSQRPPRVVSRASDIRTVTQANMEEESDEEEAPPILLEDRGITNDRAIFEEELRNMKERMNEKDRQIAALIAASTIMRTVTSAASTRGQAEESSMATRVVTAELREVTAEPTRTVTPSEKVEAPTRTVTSTGIVEAPARTVTSSEEVETEAKADLMVTRLEKYYFVDFDNEGKGPAAKIWIEKTMKEFKTMRRMSLQRKFDEMARHLHGKVDRWFNLERQYMNSVEDFEEAFKDRWMRKNAQAKEKLQTITQEGDDTLRDISEKVLTMASNHSIEPTMEEDDPCRSAFVNAIRDPNLRHYVLYATAKMNWEDMLEAGTVAEQRESNALIKAVDVPPLEAKRIITKPVINPAIENLRKKDNGTTILRAQPKNTSLMVVRIHRENFLLRGSHPLVMTGGMTVVMTGGMTVVMTGGMTVVMTDEMTAVRTGETTAVMISGMINNEGAKKKGEKNGHMRGELTKAGRAKADIKGANPIRKGAINNIRIKSQLIRRKDNQRIGQHKPQHLRMIYSQHCLHNRQGCIQSRRLETPLRF
eukprot:GHVU01192064.1.p1 GENE.GHVU01192064.1~~GHVU01192064.1.p1  ORF type:complete len:549 (+),score=100.67 GHVU01192064.1:1092-2738(+)